MAIFLRGEPSEETATKERMLAGARARGREVVVSRVRFGPDSGARRVE